MDCSTPCLRVLQHLSEFAQTHVHWVGDAIQTSHPVAPFSSFPQSFPAWGPFPSNPITVDSFSLSSCIGLFQWIFTYEILPQPQFSSVFQSCPTLCDPMDCSMPGIPVHHQLLEFIQTHVHRVSDAIQPSHPLSVPSPTAPNPSQHQSLSQWVNSSHEVAKVLEFQL